jgi:glutamate mutase epsilon subunit
MKIGQYPSYRDIESPQIKKFQKVLGGYYTELNKAIGLYSHGVGIGLFVYLRRIIEKLVHDTFKEAEAAGAITELQFEYQIDGQHRNGMEEKIRLLKGFLTLM